jgi:hypothetical protein
MPCAHLHSGLSKPLWLFQNWWSFKAIFSNIRVIVYFIEFLNLKADHIL